MAGQVSSKSNHIGQFRFSSPSSCYSDISSVAKFSYWPVAISANSDSTDTNAASFQDLDIKVDVNNAFDRKTDYYLWVKIPQDLFYDFNINVKLMKRDTDNIIYYQNLKYISILKGGGTSGVHNVVLFENPISKSIQVEISQNDSGKYIDGVLYKKTTNNITEYRLGQSGGKYVKVENYNDTLMTESWRHDTGENFVYAQFMFRPIEEDFCDIVFELVRDATDYNIQSVDEESGSIIYGRIIDSSKCEFKLFKMNNLVQQISNGIPLDQIGIWSHPGLPMCINGEEVFVGVHNYYELDTIPIESISIAADDMEDFFTIDYRFSTED